MTPTTYGRDFAYCLKSHGGVRGFNASLWRFLLRCTLFCHSVATFLTSVSSYEGGCGFEVYVKCPWDFFGREPIVWIRSAEAYLNRAEARVLADAQDLEGALEDLNELRRHRIANYTDVNYTDVETLLTEIRNERRKELCFEGHRWFDLRRYGMPSITRDFRTRLSTPLLRYTLKEKDPFYTLPIPKDIMENNNKLEQNPSAFAPERIGVPIQ